MAILNAPFGRNQVNSLISAARPALSAKMPRLRAALASTREGTANSNILIIGDSTSYGAYPVGSTSRANGWPTKAAQRAFDATGLNAGWQNFFGSSHPGLDPTTADPRIVVSGAMTFSGSNLNSLGGRAFMATSAGALAFTPTVNVDTFDIYYVAAFGMTFNRNIDGGADTLVTPPVTNNSIQKATVTTTLGSHTLNLKWNAGNFYVVGVDAYSSATRQVSIWNAAWFGSSTTNWTGNTFLYDPLQALVSIAPHATVINLGINDWNGSVAVSLYKTRMQTIITAAATVSDIVLVAPVPTDSTATRATQAEFVAAVHELAITNNCPVIDLWNAWGGNQDILDAYGMYSDTVHPSAKGQADTAQRFLRFISDL